MVSENTKMVSVTTEPIGRLERAELDGIRLRKLP